MQDKAYRVKLTFTEPVLGSSPLDAEIYDRFIRSREPSGDPEETADELASVPTGDSERGKTGFHRLPDGTPFLYDYVLRGYFKEACGSLARIEDSRSKKLKAYKKVIDGLVFVEPRQIPIHTTGPISTNQRPLRAQTMQGERITLASSEQIPAGSHIEFVIIVLGDSAIPEELIREWLDYGRYRGIGQWRNASWGRYTYELTPIDEPIDELVAELEAA